MAQEVGPASAKAGNKAGSQKPLAAIGPRCADSMKARSKRLHQQAEYTTATDLFPVMINSHASALLREESIYDPVTNPMGWEVEVLGDWLKNIDSGWSPKCLDRKALNDEWGILKLGSVTWCEFDESEQKALPSDLQPRPEIELHAGDLLFARKNTYELVAAVAYVHEVRPKLMLPDLIFRLRLKADSDMEPRFLWQLLIQPRQRRLIQQLAGGAAGSMPNISKTKLRAVRLPKPPLNLQRRFAAIVDSVEQQKARLRAHLAELDALFASLQSRAFNGAL